MAGSSMDEGEIACQALSMRVLRFGRYSGESVDDHEVGLFDPGGLDFLHGGHSGAGRTFGEDAAQLRNPTGPPVS